MQLPNLVLDTSACSLICDSANRGAIDTLLQSKFRRAVSIQTFWELLDKISGGDGSFFAKDKEVIKMAAGRTRPLFLPTPVAYAIQVVLKVPRPEDKPNASGVQADISSVRAAKTRDELYTGVRLPGAVNQRVVFDQARFDDSSSRVRRPTSTVSGWR